MSKVSKSIYLCDTEINLTTCSRLGAACAALRSPLRAVIGAEIKGFSFRRLSSHRRFSFQTDRPSRLRAVLYLTHGDN